MDDHGRRFGIREVGLFSALLFIVCESAAQTTGTLHLSSRLFLIFQSLFVVSGVTAVVLGETLKRRHSRLHARREANQRDRKIAELLTTKGWGGDDLPRVRALKPYDDLGVSRSTYVRPGVYPPYVPRDVDAEIDEALRQNQFLLVTGDSKAGKTRTAFEAIRRVYPNSPVVVPRAGLRALAGLLSLDPPLNASAEPVLLWLDDVDRFIADGGIDAAFLAELNGRRPRTIVVATLNSGIRDRLLSADGQVGRAARVMLDAAHAIHLDRVLKPGAERAEAIRLYPAEDPTRGFGEQLVAAPMLEQRYVDAGEANPPASAVIQAAIDWRRAGMPRPIPEATLFELFKRYLRVAGPDIDPTPETFSEGLRFARRPVASEIALVERVDDGSGDPSYRAHDYALSLADRKGAHQSREIPDAIWWHLLHMASPRELLRLGFVASMRGSRVVARTAWEQAVARGETDSAFNLGVLLEEEGDLAAATDAYRFGSSSTDPRVAARARLNLGLLLDAAGDLEQAEELFRAVADCPEPELAARGSLQLGLLLTRTGRAVEGEAALVVALASADSTTSAPAAFVVAAFRRERGDDEGALEAYASAANEADGPFAGQAALRTGQLLEQLGRIEEARESYERARASSDSDLVPQAELALGGLAGMQGDYQLAEDLLERAAAANHPIASPRAKVDLGLLAQERGDFVRARALFIEVLPCDEHQASAKASAALARLFATIADVGNASLPFNRARDLGEERFALVASMTGPMIGRGLALLAHLDEPKYYERYDAAVADGDAGRAAEALIDIGLIRTTLGDLDGARTAFEEAASSGTERTAAGAQLNLGLLLGAEGALDDAREVFIRAASLGDVLVTAKAKMNLSLIAEAHGDVPRAIALLEEVVAEGPLRESNGAALHLATYYSDNGNLERAKELLEHACMMAEPEFAPHAAIQLGLLLASEGQIDAATEYLRTIADDRESPAAGRAAVSLAAILLEAQPEEAAPLCERAISQGDPVSAARAAFLLGQMKEAAGDLDSAKRAYRMTLRFSEGEAVARALVQLGLIARGEGDEAAAEHHLRRAYALNEPDAASIAALNLGELHAARGESDDAAAAFRAAIQSGRMGVSGPAALQLGLLLFEQDVGRAREALEGAMLCGDERVVPVAALNLGLLLHKEGNRERALAAYTAAEQSGDDMYAPRAALARGELLRTMGEVDAAQVAFEKALSSPEADVSDLAGSALSALLSETAVLSNRQAAARPSESSDGMTQPAAPATSDGRVRVDDAKPALPELDQRPQLGRARTSR